MKKRVGEFTEQDKLLRERRVQPNKMRSDDTNVLEVDYILANYSRKLNESPSPRKLTKTDKPNPMIKQSPLEKFTPEELMSKNLQKM